MWFYFDVRGAYRSSNQVVLKIYVFSWKRKRSIIVKFIIEINKTVFDDSDLS